MSRITNRTVAIPRGVDVTVTSEAVRIKGSLGEATVAVKGGVAVSVEGDSVCIDAESNASKSKSQAGTLAALVENMVKGVTQKWEKRLQVQGVGYRANATGRKLNLQVGFSHPIDFAIPHGVDVETPTVTEIVVSGIDRQQVGQVAAEIRKFRPPEPYKGKGVRYVDEYVRRKEGKKR